jgi:hypothetical protein
MDAEVAAVEAWRDRLEALQATQPFAQVWREVYALTDAERATGTYTNRWAAHILKQHQAMTLARLNGWRVTHRMCVDAPNDEPWHLVIPACNLVADYWVQGTGGENPQALDSAAYAYVSTDRVQFHRVPEGAADSATGPRRGDPVPLAEIPPVVFSEIMRHADLFTAVASIAADPEWLDRASFSGRIGWGRLTPPENQKARPFTPLRSSPVAFFNRDNLGDWLQLSPLPVSINPSDERSDSSVADAGRTAPGPHAKQQPKGARRMQAFARHRATSSISARAPCNERHGPALGRLARRRQLQQKHPAPHIIRIGMPVCGTSANSACIFWARDAW